MLKPRLSLATLSALLSMAIAGFADTVTLKSGEKLEGRILSETDTELTIEVKITASIKDERVVKKADIASTDRAQPDLEAWEGLKNIALGEESLELPDYQRAINLLNGFALQFPQSKFATEAKAKITAFEEEMKRAEKGEMKLAGKWLTPDQVKEEKTQINGRILYGRMSAYAKRGQLVEAMNAFDGIEKSASGSSSYPDAVILARQVLPLLKSAADQGRAGLKARAEENKRRLDNVQGAERQQLEAIQKQQAAQTEALVTSFEKSGVKYPPLSPATDRSLTTISSKAATELSGLSRHHVPRMKDSLAATEIAKAAIEKNDAATAEKSLTEANSAWSKNEYIARLQPKLAVAKTKAAETAKAEAAALAAAITPTPAPKPKPTPTAASTVAVEEELKKEEGSLFGKPVFWVILVLLAGFGALGMKAMRKYRDPAKNILDQ